MIIIHLLMISLVKILMINVQMREYVPFIAMAPIDPCQYTVMKMRCKSEDYYVPIIPKVIRLILIMIIT